MGFTPTSTSSESGLHVAIIMDGNGRWATRRGKPRSLGHRAGADAVRRTVEASPPLGVSTLTLYAFSADNWKRSWREVTELLRLFERHLRTEMARCSQEGIRVNIIGRRDRLPHGLVSAIERAESTTISSNRLRLRIAVDYSARDAIVEAARQFGSGTRPSREEFSRALARAAHSPIPSPDVDLLIRTGGEKRLSDFLLWENAYAEILFSDVMWPDFGNAELTDAVDEFRRRERRFGALGSRDTQVRTQLPSLAAAASNGASSKPASASARGLAEHPVR